jgi:hypothetical protein
LIEIGEKCLRSLDQEPGGAMCLLYSYRVDDRSLETLIRTKHGGAIVEFLSDHQLYSKQLSEVFGIPTPEIKIIQKDRGCTSSNNPVPG